MTPVIAPNFRQFTEFCRQERNNVEKPWPEGGYVFLPPGSPEKLRGYSGELVIVNADECDLLTFAEYHDDKRCPIRWVDLP